MVKRFLRWGAGLVRRVAGTAWLTDAYQQLQQQGQEHAVQLAKVEQQGHEHAVQLAKVEQQARLLTPLGGEMPVKAAVPIMPAAIQTTGFSLAPGERIRVLFVFQHASVWSSWRSVIRACMNDPRFEPLVLLTPFQHATGSLDAQDHARHLLLRERIPFFVASHVDLLKTRPHVAFLQNPYDETRPPALCSAALDAIGCRVAYIPYGLEIGGGAANLQWQFDTELHRRAWRIYARSERHRLMFARYCAVGSGHVRVTGHPKLDLEVPAPSAWVEQLRAKADGRPVLLWTPHFSVGAGTGWSTFEVYGQTILDHVASHPDLFLLVRPHPMFFPTMRLKGVWTEAQEAAFRERLATSPNMALDDQPEYEGAFAVASALLADAGSFLLEFLPTGKPIVYLHRVDGPGLSEEGTVTESYVVVRDACELPGVLDRLGRGEDPQRDRRLAVVQEFLHIQDAHAGERICADIAESLASGSRTWLRVQEHDEASTASQDYWKLASNSYLADPSYYERKAQVLLAWLEQARPSGQLLDVGCSDGRYSAIVSGYFESVLGSDLSPALIEQARQRSDIAPSCKAQFIVADLETFTPVDTYDCVLCMGVTSCIPSDVAFLRLLDRLTLLTRQGGYLVLVDTVAGGSTVRTRGQDGYVATYRNEEEYLSSIARRGFSCVHVEELARETERNLVNRFRVYRKDDA